MRREGMALQELQYCLGYNVAAHQDILPHTIKAKHQCEIDNSKNGHRYEVPRLLYEDITQIWERILEQKMWNTDRKQNESHR